MIEGMSGMKRIVMPVGSECISYNDLLGRDALELSYAVFSRTWSGKRFVAVQTRLRPLHNMHLPSAKGSRWQELLAEI